MKYFLPIIMSLTLMACPASLEDIVDTPLSTAEIAKGLKEALSIGTDEASAYLSATDGYYKSAYKILLPDEARQITQKLKVIPGFSQVEEVILEKINRAAEDAAKSAGPIFLSAIKSMSINDAMGILMGQQNAATQYLHRSTYDNLYGEFQPVLYSSLEKFNANKYWADAVNAYNKIPFTKKMNPELDRYVTEQALKGLFSLVEVKEKGIREDVSQRVTPLLQKVFAKQDNNG